MIDDADKRLLAERGYFVLERLVPEALCAAVRSAVCRYLDVDEHDPSTWHRPGIQGHGIVPLHHAQALWDLRQYEPIHRTFAELHGTDALWVTIDRVSFKAPASGFPEPYRVEPVHWDGEPSGPKGVSFQGLVYLNDTPAEQGGFCCVPELFRRLEDWLARQEAPETIRRPDVEGYEIETVGAPAGSLIVWDRRLPHSSAVNRGTTPRFVQYVAMNPAGDETQREALARLVREKRPPEWALRQRVPGQQNPEPGPPARLSALGARLAGLEPWPG